MSAAWDSGQVEAGGFHLRYRQAGTGESLVSLRQAGGAGVAAADDLLAERHRVIVMALPGAGPPAPQDLARAVAQAAASLGVKRFNLAGHGSAAEVALWLALQHPERVQALVLVAPMALHTEGAPLPGDDGLVERLSGLATPTLALFGTRDREAPPELGRAYRERLPNCHVVLVYNSDHAIDADRPEAFVSVVDDFLQRRERFIVSRHSALRYP